MLSSESRTICSRLLNSRRWRSMGKRRITLFIEFGGEPNDDSVLAHHVAEALVNRFCGVGVVECPSFSPGPAVVNSVDIAVGATKLARVEYIPKSDGGNGFTAIKTSDLKHG